MTFIKSYTTMKKKDSMTRSNGLEYFILFFYHVCLKLV
jgi:hypothetical protein